MLKPSYWNHSAGVGIRFSLRSLPAHCNLGFCVGHWNLLNSPSLGVYPGTSSPANLQGLYPTLNTPGSPISSWRTLQKNPTTSPGFWNDEPRLVEKRGFQDKAAWHHLDLVQDHQTPVEPPSVIPWQLLPKPTSAQAGTWVVWITCLQHCSLECLKKA